jgi:hypothetical protein
LKTRFVAGSIRCTVRPSRFVTQTEPNANAESYVTAPTGIRATTSPVAGSTRSTPPDWVTTQSEPAANRSSHGVASTFVRATTAFVAGSIFSSSPACASVNQTAPAAAATPHGCRL